MSEIRPSSTTPPSRSDRRTLLRRSLLSAGLFSLGTPAAWAAQLPAVPPQPRDGEGLRRIAVQGGLGELLPPDALGLRLPAGFSARLIARSGQTVGSTGYRWHSTPDGGACVALADGGWIYVSNCELGSGQGGASAIDFDAQGNIRRAYSICSGTSRNCAGGMTPWGTYLSCEEVDRGRVIECDPKGQLAPVARNAMGWFDHEAVAFDPSSGHAYMTEDKSDGRLYRFRPTRAGDLSAGTLEVARRVGRAAPYTLEWLTVPTPNPSSSGTRTRKQVSKSSSFNGGEGIWCHQGTVYFTTKGDNRVWALELATQRLHILYDDSTHSNPVLTGVDNVVVSQRGDVYVAEDGGDMQICMISPNGEVAPVVKLEGQDASEMTGIAFSPDGTRLYFSSQRGSAGSGSDGRTYEVRGPFLSS
ncbi:secreted PhoX family phosphatase [Inhella inkyongensis]|uniref:Secreted PhoX family phosphatase n=1 Tax=Inhella inkyongensis TaxID=392593 RepID=A0A840S1Z5_9BURK|nr:alkaline phosphatase PhoX [Inhella inkyongensis]MBB5205187.1 secreted PhoX family phosphatase [Inhella inkyongensis]